LRSLLLGLPPGRRAPAFHSLTPHSGRLLDAGFLVRQSS